MFGVLAINKPAGNTSRDVVNRIQRLIKPVKVGHTGTLDPLATGVLLLAIGPATRLVEFAHEARKSYLGTFELGKRSDTLDIEGEVESLQQEFPSESALRQELANCRGTIEQVPPKYSAINVGGKRAYDLARRGQEFELPTRQVQIHELELTHFELPHFQLDVTCSTGTYIRTLGSDIAQRLGSDAIMTALTRTQIGTIGLEDCIELDAIDDMADVQANLLPPTRLLTDMPHAELSHEACQQIRNGIPIELRIDSTAASSSFGHDSPVAAVSSSGDLVAILRPTGKLYRSLRVFQSATEINQPKSTRTPQSPES